MKRLKINSEKIKTTRKRTKTTKIRWGCWLNVSTTMDYISLRYDNTAILIYFYAFGPKSPCGMQYNFKSANCSRILKIIRRQIEIRSSTSGIQGSSDRKTPPVWYIIAKAHSISIANIAPMRRRRSSLELRYGIPHDNTLVHTGLGQYYVESFARWKYISE